MNYRYGRPVGTMRSSRERGDPRRFVSYGSKWYRQGVGITTATGVSQWADAVGSASALAQATAGFQPALNATGAANGGACVVGDGSDDFLTVAFTLVQPEEIWTAAKMAAGTTGTIFDGGASNNVMRFYRTGPTQQGMYAGSAQLTPGVETPTAWHIYRAKFAGASSLLDIDNVNKISADAGASNGGGITLFAMGGGVFDWSATSIAETMVFSAALPSSEASRVYASMRSRVGVG